MWILLLKDKTIHLVNILVSFSIWVFAFIISCHQKMSTLTSYCTKTRMVTPLFCFVFGNNVSKFTIRESFKKFLCVVLFQLNYLNCKQLTTTSMGEGRVHIKYNRPLISFQWTFFSSNCYVWDFEVGVPIDQSPEFKTW